MLKNLNTTEQNLLELKLHSTKVFNETAYNFLYQHNGLRPHKIHLVIARASGGKSTLRNSLIYDFLKYNASKKVMLWLSEETVRDFETDLAYNPALGASLKDVSVASEQDSIELFNDSETSFQLFEEAVISSDCDLFIFDNLTTSKLYGSSFRQQEQAANRLKAFLQRFSIASLFFAHTKTGIGASYQGLINVDDIRGNRAIVNLAEFAYAMQTIQIGSSITTMLTTNKHRGQPIKSNMFLLKYNSEKRIYSVDVEVSFEEFKELWKNRNKL